MKKKTANINCPAFEKQEQIIKKITRKINETSDVDEKAEYVEELKHALEVLLACPSYQEQKLDCDNCRFITNLRKRTAELVIKARKLAGKM